MAWILEGNRERKNGSEGEKEKETVSYLTPFTSIQFNSNFVLYLDQFSGI